MILPTLTDRMIIPPNTAKVHRLADQSEQLCTMLMNCHVLGWRRFEAIQQDRYWYPSAKDFVLN